MHNRNLRRSIKWALIGAWTTYITAVIYMTVHDIRIERGWNSIVVAGLIITTVAAIQTRADRRIDVVATSKYRDGYADGYVDGVARREPQRSLHVVR
jgi:hypothetical protein